MTAEHAQRAPHANESRFDPGAAAPADSGIFGLPHDRDAAKVIVVPVPWAATTSYGGGAERGPAAVLAASRQVDLFDVETGRPYEAGIHMLPIPEDLLAWNAEARLAAEKIIEVGGRVLGDSSLEGALSRVNELSAAVNERTYETVRTEMAKGKLIALLGGDHAAPFGGIRAVAEAHPGMGILHIDAHADLRDAYEGFTFSHASIMHNVMTRIPGVAALVQVGIRDLSEEEHAAIEASRGKIRTHFDADLARRAFEGETWRSQVDRIVSDLPPRVYISFDIDGLDPTLCPHTGTPVPGGLSFHQATSLIAGVARSGRVIVGVDLNEVVPGDEGDEWDGNVGARILYKMIGWMLVSHAQARRPSSPAR
jgi:agmatinase